MDETNETEQKSEVQKAQDILEQITQQNEIMKENLKRQENLIAKNMLSGKSVGGDLPKTQEEDDEEKANAFIEAAGF